MTNMMHRSAKRIELTQPPSTFQLRCAFQIGAILNCDHTGRRKFTQGDFCCSRVTDLRPFTMDIWSWRNWNFFHLDVSQNGGFYTQIIHLNRVFHYKPSILGYPCFWKHQFQCPIFSCSLSDKLNGFRMTALAALLRKVKTPELHISWKSHVLRVSRRRLGISLVIFPNLWEQKPSGKLGWLENHHFQ